MKKLLTRKQYDKYFKKIPDNVCTFCQWEKHQIILKEFEHWLWIANLAPYWRWHTMLIPKRHFVEYHEMTFLEAGELTTAILYANKRMLDAKLEREDGTLVEKIVHFWRYRANRFDPQSGTVRPNHFHLHITPDKDHLWDPILDESPTEVDIVDKLGSKQ